MRRQPMPAFVFVIPQGAVTAVLVIMYLLGYMDYLEVLLWSLVFVIVNSVITWNYYRQFGSNR